MPVTAVDARRCLSERTTSPFLVKNDSAQYIPAFLACALCTAESGPAATGTFPVPLPHLMLEEGCSKGGTLHRQHGRIDAGCRGQPKRGSARRHCRRFTWAIRH